VRTSELGRGRGRCALLDPVGEDEGTAAKIKAKRGGGGTVGLGLDRSGGGDIEEEN